MTPRLALLAALMLSGAAVQAQTPAPAPVPYDRDGMDPTRLQIFILTPYYTQLLRQTLARVPPQTFNRCPTMASGRPRIAMLSPVHYNEDGFPSDGSWKQSFPVSGCGPDTELNFFFTAKPGRRIDAVIGLPGTTRAEPALQHDAEPYAVRAAARLPLDKGAAPCTTFNVKNTSFEAFGLAEPPTPDPGAAAPFRPWWESWTLEGCGRTYAVPMNFTPHAGSIEVVQPGHVTLLPAEARPNVSAGAELRTPPPAPTYVPPPPAPPAPALPPPPAYNPPAQVAAAPLPGSSHADPALQQDAMRYAINGAANALQEQSGTPCPSLTVTDTKFEAYGLENPPTPDPGATDPARPWWESWTVAGCGRRFLVPLDFTPRNGSAEIVQPGHVTQPKLSNEVVRSPYAKDDPPAPAKP